MGRQEVIGRYHVAARANRRSETVFTPSTGCDTLLSIAPKTAASDGSNADVFPRINLDANANAKPTPAVIEAVVQALTHGANPSSAYGAGDEARGLLEAARDALCDLCTGVFPENVVFTSGCTEANNLVIASCLANDATLITTTIEHPSVLRPAEAFAARGGALHLLPVDANGLVDLEQIEAMLTGLSGPVVLSIQAANSETGVLQPLAEIGGIAASHKNVLFHADAAQAFGKVTLVVGGSEGPDVISVSGHKLHAPMGVGALLMAEGEHRLRSQLLGGEQEGGLRAGKCLRTWRSASIEPAGSMASKTSRRLGAFSMTCALSRPALCRCSRPSWAGLAKTSEASFP